MATIVGKKFPDLSVNAMNEMGDTIIDNAKEERAESGSIPKYNQIWLPCIHCTRAILEEKVFKLQNEKH